MNAFNLEKALAGEKVVTRDGREVTQLVSFDGVDDDYEYVYAFVDQSVLSFYGEGRYCLDSDSHSNDLFMAPKKLSGFVNVYKDGVCADIFTKKEHADRLHNKNRLACIDLSQFDEGHGL